MNVLILINDRLLNWAISLGLQKENHTVYNCFDENKATEVLESQQIDIIISEIMIEIKTEMNPLPFLKQPIVFGIPIIIISNLLFDAKIIEKYKLKCTSFFSKPIDPILIIKEVNRISNIKKQKTLPKL